jgi:hypothetical protein
MNDQTADQQHEQRYAQFVGEVARGTTMHYAAESNASADRMRYYPMTTASDYGKMVAALGMAAQMGDFYAAACSEAVQKVSPYFNTFQNKAAVARAFSTFITKGWYDVATATGPEASRPSAHQHEVTLKQAVMLNLIYREVTGENGLGWALRRLVQEENVRPWAMYLPNMAKVCENACTAAE